jgi:hypothetical protein
MKREIMPEWFFIRSLRVGGMDETVVRYKERKAAYFFFLEHILECVAGKKEWKKDKYSSKVSEAVTVSDEAFALLLLDNSWDVFQEHASQGGREENKTKIITKPKYTGKRGGSKRFEGWSREGIVMYNTLCQDIVADRRSALGEEFEIDFLNYIREKGGGKRRRDEESSDGKDEDGHRPVRAWRDDDYTRQFPSANSI